MDIVYRVPRLFWEAPPPPTDSSPSSRRSALSSGADTHTNTHTHHEPKGPFVLLRDSFTQLQNSRSSDESHVFDLINVSVRCFH